jgi:ABC-type transport system involved in multi-copper enzyme maturation permease subunit
MTLFGIILGIFWGQVWCGSRRPAPSSIFYSARPLQRWQLIIGKFIGLALTQLISVALMASILLLTLLVLPAASSGEGPRDLLTGLGLSLFPVC